MKNNSKYFNNYECEYYPCHKIDKRLPFNCKYCFCPLYFLENCEGNYTMIGKIKDCSNCVIPHNNWNIIDEKLLKYFKKLSD